MEIKDILTLIAALETKDILTLIASVIAILISLGSLGITSYMTRKAAHRAQVMAQYDREMDYHGNLADDLSALRLYGVDENSFQDAGVTPGQFRYLLRYLIAIGAKIDYEKKTTAAFGSLERAMYEHLLTCTHCRHVFRQKQTREVYKFVRYAVSDFVRAGVDRRLKEEYKIDLPEAWVEPEEHRD